MNIIPIDFKYVFSFNKQSLDLSSLPWHNWLLSCQACYASYNLLLIIEVSEIDASVDVGWWSI